MGESTSNKEEGKPDPNGIDMGKHFRRELLCETLLRVTKPHIVPYLERFFQVNELMHLSELVSVGENQLLHTTRMVELAASIPNNILDILKITREDLITVVILHDVGKGQEVDDRFFEVTAVHKGRVPSYLRYYPGMKWAEWVVPFHDHVGLSYQIAKKYTSSPSVLEGVALHHHVKIRPWPLNLVCDALKISSIIKMDISHYKPAQYAAPGGNLTQVVAILDQLCAIERKFRGISCLGLEPQRIEYEVVRDLVIGLTGEDDPRLEVLGVSLTGKESVILLDLRAFGSFVKMHTEYEVQSMKAAILQLLRSQVRITWGGRARDLVALIGGDEYAVVTEVQEPEILEDMIKRAAAVIKLKTGLQVRAGYGIGRNIAENYHHARIQAEMMKEYRFLTE